jgi:hypothetical protein
MRPRLVHHTVKAGCARQVVIINEENPAQSRSLFLYALRLLSPSLFTLSLFTLSLLTLPLLHGQQLPFYGTRIEGIIKTVAQKVDA